MNKLTRVACGCGWEGRRVRRICELCDDRCACAGHGYGRCPRCKGAVSTIEQRREWEKRPVREVT